MPDINLKIGEGDHSKLLFNAVEGLKHNYKLIKADLQELRQEVLPKKVDLKHFEDLLTAINQKISFLFSLLQAKNSSFIDSKNYRSNKTIQSKLIVPENEYSFPRLESQQTGLVRINSEASKRSI